MKILKRKRKAPSIPLSSTSDIGFLLLIFIMLVSLINYRKEVKIDYPEATKIENVHSKKNFEIWIDAGGTVYYKGNPVSAAELESSIVDAYTKNPDTRVHVIADKNTRYENINNVIEILKLLQYRSVSFVIKEDMQ